MNKTIPTTIALSIVLIAAILAGGFVYWKYFSFQEELSNQPEIVIPEESIGETTNWNTYTNENYGFEIKYPTDFIPHQLSSSGVLFRVGFWDKNCSTECGSVEISIRMKEGKNFQQIKEEAESIYSSLFSKNISLEEIIVDGKQAYIQLGYEFRLGGFTVVDERYVYDISRWYSEKDVPEELFNQIFSTFKFIRNNDLTEVKEFTYTENNQLFFVREKEEFKVVDKIDELFSCGNYPNPIESKKQYLEKIKSKFSENDVGVIYEFVNILEQYFNIWEVIVIPNKVGYVNKEDFEYDFGWCEAGEYAYPLNVNKNYILFTPGCGSGAGGEGCYAVRTLVEPTIILK